MAKIGRFMQLDDLLRKISQSLLDVENADSNIALSSQRICKLLYYTEKNPLNQPDQNRIDAGKPAPTFETLADVQEYIINKRVLLVPRVPAEEERGSFIVVIIDDFTLSDNKEFKPNAIMFDVLCHHDDWLLNISLRPFLIMQQIDNIFNNKKLSIGKVEFDRARTIVLTPTMMGYNLVYRDVSFN